MIPPRVIPVLLLRGRGLYKTVKFKDPVYVGDPLNTVRLFNEKEANEIVVLDIGATAEGRGPNFEFLEEPISLNLNIGTVLSRDFQNFHRAVAGHAENVVIEMQVIRGNVEAPLSQREGLPEPIGQVDPSGYFHGLFAETHAGAIRFNDAGRFPAVITCRILAASP